MWQLKSVGSNPRSKNGKTVNGFQNRLFLFFSVKGNLDFLHFHQKWFYDIYYRAIAL